jgi:hypothetical protein
LEGFISNFSTKISVRKENSEYDGFDYNEFGSYLDFPHTRLHLEVCALWLRAVSFLLLGGLAIVDFEEVGVSVYKGCNFFCFVLYSLNSAICWDNSALLDCTILLVLGSIEICVLLMICLGRPLGAIGFNSLILNSIAFLPCNHSLVTPWRMACLSAPMAAIAACVALRQRLTRWASECLIEADRGMYDAVWSALLHTTMPALEFLDMYIAHLDPRLRHKPRQPLPPPLPPSHTPSLSTSHLPAAHALLEWATAVVRGAAGMLGQHDLEEDIAFLSCQAR